MAARAGRAKGQAFALLCALVACAPAQGQGDLLAFPGAAGFGAQAEGGRGGRALMVTNLNDAGPGSLRAALTARGPRTAVFRLGGTITLRTPLVITEPYVTIAGQSAPGGGIALRNHPANADPPLIVRAHDVVIRFIRVRPGPSREPACCLDALRFERGAQSVIVDHSSFSWSVDELVDAVDDARGITVQWSLLAEALDDSSHPKGRHSRAMLLAGPDSGDFSIHHNLFAHNAQRNPLLDFGRGVADVVNNVIYHPQSLVAHVGDSHGTTRVNFVANLFKPGPRTNHPTLPLYPLDAEPVAGGTGEFALFVAGNLDDYYRPDPTLPDALSLDPADHGYLVATPFAAPAVPTSAADLAYEQVLARAGALLPARDAVDARVVEAVRAGTGRLVDHPGEVGGWPRLARGTPPADDDRDGMPDEWEAAHGLDPAHAADQNGDLDGDGYTNLEDYLNELAGEPPTD